MILLPALTTNFVVYISFNVLNLNWLYKSRVEAKLVFGVMKLLKKSISSSLSEKGLTSLDFLDFRRYGGVANFVVKSFERSHFVHI